MFLRKILFIFIFSIFTLGIIGYGIYKALPIILGPKINLISPKNGDLANGSTIQVYGEVLRANKLYINNIAIDFNQNSYFETKVSVFPGNNILQIMALDKFGRSTFTTINVGAK